MQLLKRAVTIIEPDELDAIDGVYADGKPILVRTEDGSRLAPVIFEVLFDDSGNFMGDHGQGLRIYYESGSYETIVPTVLSFGDGMLMADDLIDWSDLDKPRETKRIPKANPSPPRPISTQIPKMTGMNIPMIPTTMTMMVTAVMTTMVTRRTIRCSPTSSRK